MKQSVQASMTKNPATQYLRVEEPFQFAGGGKIPRLDIAYETWGRLDADHSNAVLILTGLSPDAHAAKSELDPRDGWWEPMIGPGKPIDTDRNFVICVNSLGSCKGSTGPASINPQTGREYRLAFPDLRIEDIGAAAILVLESLGISQLRALVGPSLGGMSCLSVLGLKPAISRHFLAISTAAQVEPFAIAIHSLQREMIVRDPHWRDGAYTDEDWPETGMRLARKLGMISYRSETEWHHRFGRRRESRYAERLFGMHFAVESYLEGASKKFIRNFDPCSYLYLSQAMDFFDFCEGYDDPQEAFSRQRLESCKVIGVTTDFLWPPHQQEELAGSFREAGIDTELQMLPCIQGHDSFLVDYERFCPAVAEYFEKIV